MGAILSRKRKPAFIVFDSTHYPSSGVVRFILAARFIQGDEKIERCALKSEAMYDIKLDRL
jgi:hypothetical protein